MLKNSFIKQRILANAYIEQEKAKEQQKKKLEMILASSGKENYHEGVKDDVVRLSKQKEKCEVQKFVYNNPKTVSKKRKSVDTSIVNTKSYNICESNILLKRPCLHRRMIAVY